MKNSQVVLDDLKNILLKNNLDFEVLNIENLKSGYDFVFVIGGDGTILKAARFYANFDIPIFGINLGRLGFLSQTLPENLEISIKQILSNNYRVEKRLMLKANGYNALNDFVIKSETLGRISRFALEIDGKFVCEYLADGIIVSTPTGSTAYGMAAGGPILTPDSEVIAVVPICPHTFTARPIVVSAESKIKILPIDSVSYSVYADGQIAFEINEALTIQKADNKADLALLDENEFYTVLRNKLHWGISPAVS